MSVAIGPNGRQMISLTAIQAAAEVQQAIVFLNIQHNNADTQSLDGKLKREKIKDGELLVTNIKLDKHKNNEVLVTARWDTPRQVPFGPHAGKWAILAPADERLKNERDARSGLEAGKEHPSWKITEIVEDDPDWWTAPEGPPAPVEAPLTWSGGAGMRKPRKPRE